MYKKQKNLKVGNPLSEDTDLGPLVNDTAIENIDGIVKDSIKEGAQLLLEETDWRLKSTIAIKDISIIQQFLKMSTEDMELHKKKHLVLLLLY